MSLSDWEDGKCEAEQEQESGVSMAGWLISAHSTKSRLCTIAND